MNFKLVGGSEYGLTALQMSKTLNSLREEEELLTFTSKQQLLQESTSNPNMSSQPS